MLKNSIKTVFKYLLVVIITIAAGLVITSSIVYLFDMRGKISNKLSSYRGTMVGGDADYYWAKEILNGGYILHFRHAERDKWIDVQMYDALESDVHENGIDESRYAENDYFSKAVCLNSRGKIQARTMGEHISRIGLPISTVVSSVSCRARQTSKLAFGGFDTQHRLLVHQGPYSENYDARINTLKKFYGSLDVPSDSNVIVSSHNSVVQPEMFENFSSDLYLEEGGFYIISQKNGKLRLEYEFHTFNNFIKIFYPR